MILNRTSLRGVNERIVGKRSACRTGWWQAMRLPYKLFCSCASSNHEQRHEIARTEKFLQVVAPRLQFTPTLVLRLRRSGSVDVNFSFLLRRCSGWRLIYHGGVTFFFLCRRISHSCFFLFTCSKQCEAGEQTNGFFHTTNSYFSVNIGRLLRLYWSCTTQLAFACVRVTLERRSRMWRGDFQ